MKDAARLLIKAGAKPIPCTRHDAYILDGVRFTLSKGSREKPRETTKVKMRLRRLGYL